MPTASSFTAASRPSRVTS